MDFCQSSTCLLHIFRQQKTDTLHHQERNESKYSGVRRWTPIQQVDGLKRTDKDANRGIS